MKAAFFLYHFNDVDHIVPVMHRFLGQGNRAVAVMLNPGYEVASDPRIQLLTEFDGFELTYIHKVLGPWWSEWVYAVNGSGRMAWARRKARSALQRSRVSVNRAVRFLRGHEIETCVFEWGGRRSRGRAEFFQAAKEVGARTVCLPHGLNIYLNADVNPHMREVVQQGRQIKAAGSHFDAYVFQSEYHKEQDVKLGIDPDVCVALGSARYCPEWHPINQTLYPDFTPEREPDGRLKVVMMLPHWEYNVDRQSTLEVISALAKEDSTHLVVKDHTRGTGGLPAEMREELWDEPGFETTVSASSVSLTRWSDAVINFGSSIGIEALLQRKHHVNPSYLHTNTTIFDKTGAGQKVGTLQDLVAVLSGIAEGAETAVPEENVQALYREVVYGGREPFDVLEAYCGLIAGQPQQ